jgi:hypothetical protein
MNMPLHGTRVLLYCEFLMPLLLSSLYSRFSEPVAVIEAAAQD